MKTTVKITEYIIDGYITCASDRKIVEFDTLSDALAFVPQGRGGACPSAYESNWSLEIKQNAKRKHKDLKTDPETKGRRGGGCGAPNYKL